MNNTKKIDMKCPVISFFKDICIESAIHFAIELKKKDLIPLFMIRVLIVDDEEEVRDLLEILLRSYRGIQVVGHAANVDQAIDLTLEKKPDLVLLDIQMPEKDGFTFIEEIRSKNYYPGVIFVTAFENFAIRAIRSAAFDYLLKPLNKDELYSALDRFTETKDRNKQSDFSEIIELLNKSKPGRIKLNTRTGYFFIDPDEIMYCEADGNYTSIQLTGGKKEVSSVSLGNMEKLLEKGAFLRISRSFIINMKYITRVDRKSNLCELEQNGQSHQIKIPPQKIKLLEGYF